MGSCTTQIKLWTLMKTTMAKDNQMQAYFCHGHRPVAAWYSLVRQEKKKVRRAKRAGKFFVSHAHFFIMTPRQHF